MRELAGRLIPPAARHSMLDVASLGRGVKVNVNNRDRMRLLARYRGYSVYEPDSWASFLDLVESDDVFVDVGANVGVWSVAAARRGARVVAFEPDRANAARCRRHAALNRVNGRVQVLEVAVGEREGALTLAARGSPVSGVVDLYLASGTRFVLAPSVRLDSVFSQEPVGLLKIDVEGYEARVLRGATGLLAERSRRPRAVLVEIHPAALYLIGDSANDIYTLLTDSGYVVDVTEEGVGGEGAARWLAHL